MNTLKQAIHMLLEHKIDSNKFVSKKHDFLYEKTKKSIAVFSKSAHVSWPENATTVVQPFSP